MSETKEPSALMKRGREIMNEVCGIDIEPDDPWLEFSHENIFGRVWDRPGLTRKERRWISLTLAAASGQAVGYVAHLRGALDSGDISEAELWEWLVHFAHYAGWPASSTVWGEMRQIFEERAAANSQG